MKKTALLCLIGLSLAMRALPATAGDRDRDGERARCEEQRRLEREREAQLAREQARMEAIILGTAVRCDQEEAYRLERERRERERREAERLRRQQQQSTN